MRFTLVPIVLFVATVCHGADDEVKASGRLGGKKVQFPAKSVAEGVKATVGLLESCSSASDGTVAYTAADLKKAQEGDHVRLVFAKPITVTVLDNKIEVSELVFTQPLNTGVFWLRVGNDVVRCSKYRFEKERDFVAWRDQATVVERPGKIEDVPLGHDRLLGVVCPGPLVRYPRLLPG